MVRAHSTALQLHTRKSPPTQHSHREKMNYTEKNHSISGCITYNTHLQLSLNGWGFFVLTGTLYRACARFKTKNEFFFQIQLHSCPSVASGIILQLSPIQMDRVSCNTRQSPWILIFSIGLESYHYTKWSPNEFYNCLQSSTASLDMALSLSNRRYRQIEDLL